MGSLGETRGPDCRMRSRIVSVGNKIKLSKILEDMEDIRIYRDLMICAYYDSFASLIYFYSLTEG